MADLLDLPALIKAQVKANPFPTSPPSQMTNVLTSPPVLIRGGLDTYIGEWNEHTAKHLLQRGMFGPTANQIAEAVEDGMALTIEKLLGPAPVADLPVNYNYQEDPNVPVGQSWVYTPIIQNTNYAQRSIRAWQFGLILGEGVSIREKMVLFWHNHFVTAEAPHAKYSCW
jgi:hypothetical protein